MFSDIFYVRRVCKIIRRERSPISEVKKTTQSESACGEENRDARAVKLQAIECERIKCDDGYCYCVVENNDSIAFLRAC